MSSLISLSPIWQTWTQQDLDKLNLQEVVRLHAILQRKVYEVENQFDKETVFWIQRRKREKEEKKKVPSTILDSYFVKNNANLK